MAAERRILLVNGPNLNLLGSREPGVYGTLTLPEIERRLGQQANALGFALSCYQSNHQDALSARVLRAKGEACGIILNAGAYTHTGVDLAKAVRECSLPVIEVHISNVFAREPFRHESLLTPVCRGMICGLGYEGYRLALLALSEIISA